MKFVFLQLMLAALVLSSCSGDEVKSEKGTVNRPGLADVLPPASAVKKADGLRLHPAAPKVTDTLTAAVKNSRPDGFSWSVNGEVLDGQKNKYLVLDRFQRGDLIGCSFTDDGRILTGSVEIANSLPEVLTATFSDPNIHRGVDIEIITDTRDADGDTVSLNYRWQINGEELYGYNEPFLAGDRFRKGDRITVWITPSDSDGSGDIYYGSEFEVPNAPPYFTSSPPPSFKAEEYLYAAKAHDPDGDKLTYSLQKGPVGMVVDSETGMLRWRIDPAAGKSHQLSIIATDSAGATAVQEYILNLSF